MGRSPKDRSPPTVADLPPDPKAVHNERTKYTATWLNTAGASAITVGVIAPLAALTFSYPEPPVPLEGLAVGVGAFFLAGTVLHLLSRLVLGRLK